MLQHGESVDKKQKWIVRQEGNFDLFFFFLPIDIFPNFPGMHANFQPVNGDCNAIIVSGLSNRHITLTTALWDWEHFMSWFTILWFSIYCDVLVICLDRFTSHVQYPVWDLRVLQYPIWDWSIWLIRFASHYLTKGDACHWNLKVTIICKSILGCHNFS